jgi:hypothetical protein
VAIDPKDLPALLEERRTIAERTLDTWGSRRETYSEWNQRQRMLDALANNDWDVVWPDEETSRGGPKILNVIVVASEHRARQVASVPPTFVKRAAGNQSKAAKRAQQIERWAAGIYQKNQVGLLTQPWAFDLMYGGMAAALVLPDMGAKKSERFPCVRRLDPRHTYPGPTFARGPVIDDCVVAYEEDIKAVEGRFGVKLGGMIQRSYGQAKVGRVKVIEFHTDEYTIATAEPCWNTKPGGTKKVFEVLMYEEHKLGKCPVVIGTRPTHDGIYRGDFDHIIGLLNTHNKLMTMHLDSGMNNVYPLALEFEIENPDDEGPGAMLHKSNPNSTFEYVSRNASPYDNYNMLRMMEASERAGSLLPPSLTGDPNESVTSAAGISATQGAPNAEVASLQRDCLVPMLQGMFELAMRADERWSDTEKTITGVQRGAPFAETYKPSDLFDGDYGIEVRFGLGTGLDPINQGVMVKQDLGAGLISQRTAREQSPLVEDPVREENQIAYEMLQQATFAGIVAQAAAPPGDPNKITVEQLSLIWDELQKPDVDLMTAIKKYTETLALQQPAAPPQPGNPTAPGIAGAGEPQPAFGGPPLEELMA